MAEEARSATVAALVDCARKGEDQNIITTLEQQPNIMKQKNFNNLVRAVVETERTEVLVWLLNHGLNKNAALDIAINNGSERVINIMLDQGADKDEGLYFAVKANKTEPIYVLLARGANINTNKRNGSSPLHVAITLKCDVDVIKFLIENRADTNARTKNNKTALDLVKNLLNGKMDLATKDKLKEVENLLKLNELNDDVFECLQGLPDGLSGYSYQIKLFTLYAIVNTKLAIADDCKYELGTEVKDLVPFDDIYSKITQDDRTNCQFVQVKQTKKPELNKIKESTFFTVLKSGDNMKKNIKGNDTIVKMFIKFDEIFSNLLKNGESGEFIYCTNTDFESPSISLFTQKSKDDLLCGVGGVKWQIEDWRYVYIEIKFVLLHLIESSKFIKLLDVGLKNKIKEQIQILDHVRVEKVIEKYDDCGLWPISKIAKVGMEITDAYLDLHKRAKAMIIMAKNVESVKNNIPDECEHPDYTGELSSIINCAIDKIDKVSKSLKNDKGLFMHFSESDDSAMRNKIENFIKHFSIYTSCPTSDQLDDIITKKLSEEFKFHKSKLLSFYCVQYFSKWISDFKNELGNLFKHEDGKKLFHDMRVQIFKGFSKSYTEDLLAYKIHFRDESKAVVDFLQQHKCRKVLHIITEYPHLHAHKVLQTLKSIENVSGFNSDNVLFTSSDFIYKSNDTLKHFFEAFSCNTSGNDLLVMAFPDHSKEDSSLYNVLDTLRSITGNDKKQIIVIANKDNTLATALKYMFKDHISYQDKVTFTDLTEDAQAFVLEKTINFMNDPNSTEIEKKLKDFLTIKAACEVIDEEMLSMILHDMNSIYIGDAKPFFSDEYNKEYYIPRRIHPQVVHNDVLRHIDDNLFLVTGISECDLISQYSVSNESIHYWQKAQRFDSGIIIIPETEINTTNGEIFAQISNECEKSISWLDFRDDLIFLKGIRTSKHDDDTRIHVEITNMNEMQLEKYSFNPEKLDQKIVILANNAGEGKSTMLTDLSYAIKEKRLDSDLWIVRVDLKEFVDIQMLTSLNNISFSVEETAKAIKTITRMAVDGEDTDVNVKLERILLEASLNGFGNMKVILLIDGFDEISPDYKEKTCVLLKALKNSDVKQMWITTRVHLKAYLEQELEEPAHVLNPLSVKEQIEFLDKYWKWNLKNHKHEESKTEEQICVQIINSLRLCYDSYLTHWRRLYVFESLGNIIGGNRDFTLESLQKTIDEELNLLDYAEVSLEELKRTLRYENDFFKVPLNLKMFAEYLYNNEWQITNLKTIGTFEIYRQFMERKIKIYRENKSTTQSGNPADRELADMASTTIVKLLREVAVKTLFPHSRFLPDLNIMKEYTNAKDTITRLGLTKFYANRVEFVHRSYAEYFFSEYLLIYLENPSVQSELLSDVLIEEQYHLVRIFFNGFLSQTESKPCSPTVLKEIMKMQNDRGESVMHIISSGGLVHIRSYVLSNTERQNNAVNTLLRFGKLQTVTDEDKWEDNEDICDIIMDKIKQYPDVLKSNKGRIVLNTAAIVSNEEVRNVIMETAMEYQNTLKRMLMKTNYRGDTALYVAAYNNNIKVCKQIMSIVVNNFDELKNIIFSVDKSGLSVMHVAVIRNNKGICDIILTAAKQREDILKKLMNMTDIDGQTALYVAVVKFRREICEAILNNVKIYPNVLKALVKKCGKEGLTCLHTAAIIDEIEICRVILKATVEHPDILKELVMMADYDGRNVLHSVAQLGKTEACNIILKAVRNDEDTLQDFMMMCDKNGHTALHVAVTNNINIICELILKAVGNKNMFNDFILKTDKNGLSAFHVAALLGLTDACKLILSVVKKRSDIFKKLITKSNYEGSSILCDEAIYGKVEIFKLILETVKEQPSILRDLILMSDKDGVSALHKAAVRGKKELCDAILASVAQHLDILESLLMKCDFYGSSILCAIASANKIEICELICHYIEGKPEIVKSLMMLCDVDGNTALHLAALKGYDEICNIIIRTIKKQADLFRIMLTKGDKDGNTLLHLAAQMGKKKVCEAILRTCDDEEILKMLVLKGDKDGDTALHVGARNGFGGVCDAILKTIKSHKDIVKILILKGDKMGSTALHVAAQYGFCEVCGAILNGSIDQPEAFKEQMVKGDREGSTPIHVAAQNGFKEVCDVFLKTAERQPDIVKHVLTLGDKFGRTPLSYLS